MTRGSKAVTPWGSALLGGRGGESTAFVLLAPRPQDHAWQSRSSSRKSSQSCHSSLQRQSLHSFLPCFAATRGHSCHRGEAPPPGSLWAGPWSHAGVGNAASTGVHAISLPRHPSLLASDGSTSEWEAWLWRAGRAVREGHTFPVRASSLAPLHRNRIGRLPRTSRASGRACSRLRALRQFTSIPF